MKKYKKTIKNIILILSIACIGLLFISCGQFAPEEMAAAANPKEIKQPVSASETPGYATTHLGKGSLTGQVIHLTTETHEKIDIQTEQVKLGPIRSTLSAMGKVLAPNNKTALVGFSCSARIVQLHTALGRWVTAGQPLVSLECTEIGSAQSEYAKAKADYELAKLDFAREERLYKKDIGAKKEYLEAKTRLQVATASLEAARKALQVFGFSAEQVKEIDQSGNVSSRITLRAPISGQVTEHHAVIGALIDSSTPIMTIIDPSKLWIDAEIYEKDLSQVKLGQKVEITVPAYPGEIFHGKIFYVGAVVDPQSRTITVRTEVANPGSRLKPGMFANIGILTQSKDDAITVPHQAVLTEGDVHIVFVTDPNQPGYYICREVKTGAVTNGNIEILSGLSLGEKVVIEGNYQLKSKLNEGILKGAHVH